MSDNEGDAYSSSPSTTSIIPSTNETFITTNETLTEMKEENEITRIFDRFPKRRRNDAVERALEDFRDEWHREIIIKTSYIGGVDKPLLERIFSFLDLPGAVNAMWTCSTWKDVVCSSNMNMWMCWCANTCWKFDYPVPSQCSDLKKYGIVRYKSEHRWLKGAIRPPTLSEIYTVPSATTPDLPPPNNTNGKMHFHENILAFFNDSSLHVLDLDNKTDHKTVQIPEADRLSSISVNRGHIATATFAGAVNIYKNMENSVEIVQTLEERVAGSVFVHLEENKMTFASNSCVRIFDLNSKASYRLPTRLTFRITSIDVCGNLLVQANSETRQIEVWDTEQQKLIKSISGGGMTKGLRIDGNCISGIEGTTQHSFYNSVLKVWDLRTQTQRTIYPSLTSDTFRNHFMHESKIVISCASDLVQVWQGSFAPTYPHTPMYEIAVPWENSLHQIDKIQCDWEKIVVGCESGSLYMWNFV